MNILLTGAAGFLAQHFIPAFKADGHTVIGIDKREAYLQPDRFIHDEIENLGYRDLMDVDVIVHLGWRTNIPDCIRHPVESTRDNIVMTAGLLQKAKEAEVKRFIFPSTASLYGDNKTPWSEDMKPRPIEPYSWQKLCCEELMKMEQDIDTVIVRFFQIYGECQRSDTAFAKFFKLKEEDKPITLTKTVAQSAFKSGQRDFIYAGDVAAAVLLLLNSKIPLKGEIFNISTNKVHTMEEIANAMECEVEWIERRAHEVERHQGDNTKIKRLGWSPTTNVIEWLQRYGTGKS